MLFKDQLGNSIDIPEVPQRVVSLVPSQTELLVDLGLRENLAGITKFCVHPEDLRKNISVVGGTKQVHFDKISALKPDLIICNKEENTWEMVQELKNIAPVWVSDIYSVEDNCEMIKSLGDIFNVSEKALKLVRDIKSELKTFIEFMKDKSVQKVLYVIWKNPYMVAGRDTFINELLEYNKYENLIEAEDSRYPEVDLSQFSKADIILLSTEPYPFKEKDVHSLKKDLSKRIILVDGEYFSWYGSRIKDAFNYFKSLHSQ